MLEAILKWKMTSDEAKVFKLCLIWEEISKKIFPNEQIIKLPKRGDPRKSNLFRQCWKLYRETRNSIDEKDYIFYIRSQLEIIRESDKSPFIDPSCLSGEKAWKRWQVWQNRIKNREKNVIAKVDIPLARIEADLLRTKKFLEKIPYNEKNLAQMVRSGMITPWFLVLSPKVAQFLGNRTIDETFDQIDFSIYRQRITEELKSLFEDLFPGEKDDPIS